MLFRSNDTATTEIYTQAYTLSLHDALPIAAGRGARARIPRPGRAGRRWHGHVGRGRRAGAGRSPWCRSRGAGGIHVSMLWPPESLFRGRHDPPANPGRSGDRPRGEGMRLAACVPAAGSRNLQVKPGVAGWERRGRRAAAGNGSRRRSRCSVPSEARPIPMRRRSSLRGSCDEVGGLRPVYYS